MRLVCSKSPSLYLSMSPFQYIYLGMRHGAPSDVARPSASNSVLERAPRPGGARQRVLLEGLGFGDAGDRGK